VRYRIGDPRAVELHAREDALMRQHGGDWLATNALLTNPADYGPVYRRGLPERACLSLDTFLRNGGAILDAHPTLREVALYGLTNRCDELTLSPLLARLDTLEIADFPTVQDAQSLIVSPHLRDIANFKLWLGGDPYFLRELAELADATWPRDIELVQVYGGAACYDANTARELNEVADIHMTGANGVMKRTAVRVTRPFEQLFPLNGDVGKNICAGHLPDGRAALAAADFYNWVLVTFDDDGRVREVEVRDSAVREPSPRGGDIRATIELGTAFVDWVDRQLGLTLDPIRVREFRVENLAVELYPSRARERIADPSLQAPHTWAASNWRDHCGQIRGWLERHTFVVHWHGEHHADWRGVIHSS